MSISSSIDGIYRRACVTHGTTPVVKRICISPETFRQLAEEVKGKSRINWYSDGLGPYYMGMRVHTAPVPDRVIILQNSTGDVVAAGFLDLPNAKDQRPATVDSNMKQAPGGGSGASTCSIPNYQPEKAP